MGGMQLNGKLISMVLDRRLFFLDGHYFETYFCITLYFMFNLKIQRQSSIQIRTLYNLQIREIGYTVH